MLKSYQGGISAIRWLTSTRDDASPVLQYGLRPINGGSLDWFDVPTEYATAPKPPEAMAPAASVAGVHDFASQPGPVETLNALFTPHAESGQVDEPAELQGQPVDEVDDLHGQVVDAEFPGTPTIAECIAQLDVWNGHLEVAIDRHALEQLGQHPNDEPFIVGRDPMEQLP